MVYTIPLENQNMTIGHSYISTPMLKNSGNPQPCYSNRIKLCQTQHQTNMSRGQSRQDTKCFYSFSAPKVSLGSGRKTLTDLPVKPPSSFASTLAKVLSHDAAAQVGLATPSWLPISSTRPSPPLHPIPLMMTSTIFPNCSRKHSSSQKIPQLSTPTNLPPPLLPPTNLPPPEPSFHQFNGTKPTISSSLSWTYSLPGAVTPVPPAATLRNPQPTTIASMLRTWNSKITK